MLTRALEVPFRALLDSLSGELLQSIQKKEPKTAPADTSGETATILGKALILSLANACAASNLATTISIGILTLASANAMTTKFVKAKRTADN